MKVQSVNSFNYQNNNNLNFKSKVVATKYVWDLLNTGIEKPRGFATIVDGFHRILNDGKNDLVKISYDNKFWQFLFPGAYKIKINNNKEFSNCYFGGRGLVVQGRFALKDVYRDENGCHIPCEDSFVAENPKMSMYRKRIHANWQRIFDEIERRGSEAKIKNLHKNMDFLEKRYDACVKNELLNLKKIIFPDGKYID